MTPDGLNSVRNIIIFGSTQHKGWDSHRWTVDITVSFLPHGLRCLSLNNVHQDNHRVIQLYEARDRSLKSNLFVQTRLAGAEASVVDAYFDDHLKQACLKNVLLIK